MGNTWMAPKSVVLWGERFIETIAPLLNVVAPFLSRIIPDIRWTYPTFGLLRRFSRWLHLLGKGRIQPDGFLLEVFNPSGPVRMQLVMEHAPNAKNKQLVLIRPQFRTTVELPQGFSRHEFDRQLFQNVTESGEAFNVSITPEADTSPNLVFLSADFVTYKRKKGGVAQALIKCVVWDLDQTIWEGVLIEEGGVRLREGIKDLLETFDQRGILLSIASKNNHDLAMQRLHELGIADYFLIPQINWNPKSQSIKNIAKKLNIGADSIAFIDDNPFELNEVKEAFAEVTCIDVKDIGGLKTHPSFQGSTTADARNRRRYYQEEIARNETQAEFGDDYHRFLASCKVELEISPYDEKHFSRVAELVQRTNQLNFSGRKYDRDQLRIILNDLSVEKFILSSSDRFGSYGLVGFALVRRPEGAIDIHDFMLSCRVQSRMIEAAFFTHLERHHSSASTRVLRVHFIETKRNQPAKQALEAAGLKIASDGLYLRELRKNETDADIVHVCCSAGCANPLAFDSAEGSGRLGANVNQKQHVWEGSSCER